MSCSGCNRGRGGLNIGSQETPELSVNTPCACEFNDDQKAIFCDRHKCLKTKSLHTLCKNRHDYFEMWENGNGPMQSMRVSPDFDGEKTQETGFFETKQETGFFETEQEEDSSKSRGLGDTIAKFTKATGIEKAVKKVFGENCGCEERRSKLNKMFPYKGKKKTKGFFE